MTHLPPAPPRAPDDDAPIRVASTGTDTPLTDQELSQLIEQFESESATRQLTGGWRWTAAILAGGLSIYGLYWTQYNITTQVYRATFLLLVLALSFLLYPLRGRRSWLEFAGILALGVDPARAVLAARRPLPGRASPPNCCRQPHSGCSRWWRPAWSATGSRPAAARRCPGTTCCWQPCPSSAWATSFSTTRRPSSASSIPPSPRW